MMQLVRVESPIRATVVEMTVTPGDFVAAGALVAVLESMKMHHEVHAAVGGKVTEVLVQPGMTVQPADTLLTLIPSDTSETAAGDGGPRRGRPAVEAPPAVRAREDLEEVRRRRKLTTDDARPEAVARRHGGGMRTARENIAALCDPGTFVEYGAFAVASQRSRRPIEQLIAETPADGFICGFASVNRKPCAVASYDYTVLAGTQGHQGHRKKDRLFRLVEQLRLPLVIFAEGGGGRPGDSDAPAASALDTEAFALFAKLSGLVPLVGVVSGRCFAGNAALLACCDVIIATANSSIGMAGPAMIEGGGLGSHQPDEIGPIEVQWSNGVVDVAVADEVEAVEVARAYLGYFQGRRSSWACADQAALRDVVPEDRRRVYDVRQAVRLLSDEGSVLELRAGFGAGMVTALARVEGAPVGLLANNPAHLGGAIDSDGADKAARFMQLCDAFDVPIVALCDTPGFMVGPEAERTAQVRHFGRMFVIGASLTVPYVMVVLRKAYGLGAQAMAAGHLHMPVLTVSWPTGEFGGMGLEGAVRLGWRRELDAETDASKRQELFDKLVRRMYERGKALNTATYFEIDDVIDPADTRATVAAALAAYPEPPLRSSRKRPCIDTW